MTPFDVETDTVEMLSRLVEGFEIALLGSTAERVVRGARIPVLSIPPAAGLAESA